MITAEDIELLIASGEGYNVEFKVTVPSKVRELTEEVCAFANAAGGILLIGISDSNEIIGVSIDNSKRSAIQQSIGDISPSLNCSLYFVEINGKSIGVIEVPSGPQKPYILSGAIYVRIGPNSQKLTSAEEMRDFFQQAGKIYFDEISCKTFSVTDDIDYELVNDFKLMAHLTTSVPDLQIFQNLKLFDQENYFKNGAVLFFGKQPEIFFEKAIVRCVAFEGVDKRYIIDDKVFGGPLYSQYIHAMQWLKGKLNIRYDIESQGGGPRKEIWEIPETVFKEAIVNSLSHRDYYEKGAVTTIELFNDRVEITNPGGLVSAISATEFGKKSHSRNPLIFGLFSKIQLVEQIGSGVARINDLMKAASLPKPHFDTNGMFTLTLKRPIKPSEKPSEKTSEKILMLIKENGKITIEELASSLGLTKKGIEFHLNKFKTKGVIQRKGSKKDGIWEIINTKKTRE